MFQRIRDFRPLSDKAEEPREQFTFLSRLTMHPSYSQQALEHALEVRQFRWRMPCADPSPQKTETPPPNDETAKR